MKLQCNSNKEVTKQYYMIKGQLSVSKKEKEMTGLEL